MNKDDIIHMAREAGLEPLSGHYNDPAVHRFAALVAAAMKKRADQEAAMQEHVFADRMEIAIAAEREACATLCEQLGTATNGIYERNLECATAIRARTTP
jgi:hypothetical protein